MTTEPLALLEALLSYSGHDVAAHQFASGDRLSPMVKVGWLVPTGVPDALVCKACDDTHLAEVIRIKEETRGLCRRTGETFPVSPASSYHRIDGHAFARLLAEALQLEGDPRLLHGFATVWKLGMRRLEDTRVVFFFTPGLNRVDMANTTLEAVAQQARAMPSVLIVADDIDRVGVLRKHRVIRLRDVAAVDADGNLTVNEAQLLFEIVPQTAKPRGPGRPPEQQELVLPLLDELDNEGVKIDASNSTCRAAQDRFIERYPDVNVPARNTVKKAIIVWRTKQQEEAPAG